MNILVLLKNVWYGWDDLRGRKGEVIKFVILKEVIGGMF